MALRIWAEIKLNYGYLHMSRHATKLLLYLSILSLHRYLMQSAHAIKPLSWAVWNAFVHHAFVFDTHLDTEVICT